MSGMQDASTSLVAVLQVACGELQRLLDRLGREFSERKAATGVNALELVQRLHDLERCA